MYLWRGYCEMHFAPVLFGQQNYAFNSSPPGQIGGKFTNVIFKCNFPNTNWLTSIFLHLKPPIWYVLDEKSSLVFIMAWHRAGAIRRWSSSATHICEAWGRWVNPFYAEYILVNIKYIFYIFHNLLTLRWHRKLSSFLGKDNGNEVNHA